MALPAEKARYSFDDCLTWDENELIEIIDGEAFMMATPSRIHQKISGELYEDYGRADVAKVSALDGCFIELNKVFSE